MEKDPGFIAAVEEARLGDQEGGIPIGSCLVSRNGIILGRGHNMRVQKGSATLHVGYNDPVPEDRIKSDRPYVVSRQRCQLLKTLADSRLQLIEEQLCTQRFRRAICVLGLV